MSTKLVNATDPSRSVAGAAEVRRTTVQALLVALVYFAGGQLGFRLKFPSIPTSIFWLPNATMFAVFLLVPVSRWWIYALAVLPAHVAVQIPNHMPPATIALLFVSNLADGALAALAIRHFSRGRAPFEGFRQVALFLLFAVLAPLMVSFADAATMVLTGRAEDYWLVWNTRFRSNVLTNIIWVPAVVTAVTRGPSWLRKKPSGALVEAALLALGLALVGLFVFGPFGSYAGTALLLAPFPVLLWGAVRFGTGGVSAALLGFAYLVIRNAARGSGPLAASSPAVNTLAVQLFLTLLAAPLLLLASLLEEKRQVAAALAERESQYRSIFESTGEGVLVTDLHTAVAAVNPAFAAMTGYGAADLAKTHPREFLRLDELQPFDAYLARIASDDPVVAQVMCVCKDGRRARFELSGKRFSYGGRAHVLSVVRDVTERDQSLRLLEQKVANQAAVAVENARLYDQARQLATVEERQRLARELQDSVTQTLFTVSMLVRALPGAWKGDRGQGQAMLDHLGEVTESALAEMRTLLLELRPSAVLQSELPELMRQLARAFRSHLERPVELHLDCAGTLPMEVHLAFYRLARAALGNVAKHAASAQAHVVLHQRADAATIVITDDGGGFDPTRAAQPPRLGLEIMRERAAAVGASMEIRSAPGQGTAVTLRWPAAQAQDR